MRTTLHRITQLGFCFAASGTLLCAQAPTLSLTAGAGWPTGAARNLVTNSAGFTLGAFADWEQHPGHGIRLALDGVFYPNSGSTQATGSDRAQSQALTLNYVFAPSANLKGFHFVLGAGAMNIQRTTGNTLDETGVKLAWNAGCGVNFDERWGANARYFNLQSDGRNLGTVTTGLTYRF